MAENGYPVRWVRLSKYCELTGETRDMVYARKRAGIWLEGLHIRRRQGKLWVCLPAVDRWVEQEHMEVR